MKRFFLVCLLILFFNSFSSGKNLQLVKKVNPINYEQIDVEIDGKLMIITGGLGGAILYNISDPENPKALSDIHLAGCPWGRSYSWDISDDATLAIGTSRECGAGIYNISIPSSPQKITHFAPTIGSAIPAESAFDISIEDVEIVGNYAIFATHSNGIMIYDISSPASPQFVSQVVTNNAFSLAVYNTLVYIADGDGGLKIIDISQIDKPTLLSSIKTSGSARDIRFKNNFVFLAVGAAGVDVVEVGDPDSPVLLDNFETRGFTSKVAVNEEGNLVSVSAWVDIEVLEWNGADLRLVGYKNTGGRVMAVGMAYNDLIISAEWEDLLIYRYGAITSPDIDVYPSFLDFSHLSDGESETLPVEVENNGLSPLNISAILSNHSDFSYQPTISSLNPGEKVQLQVTYSANSSTAGGQLLIYSDDPDGSITSVKLSGNSLNKIAPGAPAPDFSLPVLTNGRNTISLSDLKGQVVVVAFFGWW